MSENSEQSIQAAEVVLPCTELDATLAFFTERLGFRLAAIFPADDPRVAVVTGHGLRLRLMRGGKGDPGALRLLCRDPATVADGATELLAPNGTRIELAASDPPLVVPPGRQEFVLTRAGDDAAWIVGRAGMQYRDLLPGRLGGRFIASHIRIPDGGPVPDFVHYHRVRLQLIICIAGWVRVIYEDQGPAFVLQAGDAVLQPPRIRHRVLECSAGLEVVELSCPAEHETLVDHELELPTSEVRPDREWDGQRFVHHRQEGTSWAPWRLDGSQCQDMGLGEATGGLASAHWVRVAGTPAPVECGHDAELVFTFVVAGSCQLSGPAKDPLSLRTGDAFVIPAGQQHGLTKLSDDLELLEVALPAANRSP